MEKATRGHIRAAIRYAQWEKAEIATKDDGWYAMASDVSRRWRDQTRIRSLRYLARERLAYWRCRAFMGVESRLGPYDRIANTTWNKPTDTCLIPEQRNNG